MSLISCLLMRKINKYVFKVAHFVRRSRAPIFLLLIVYREGDLAVFNTGTGEKLTKSKVA